LIFIDFEFLKIEINGSGASEEKPLVAPLKLKGGYMIGDRNADKINRLFPAGSQQNQPTPPGNANQEWFSEYEGQLAIDAYQTDDAYIIKAPIAGVKKEDLDVNITETTVTIKGSRKESEEIKKENYIAQECYWGSFTRSFQIPKGADTEKATAVLKNGILTIKIPKEAQSKAKSIDIKDA
jgi:HSP20 family protein